MNAPVRRFAVEIGLVLALDPWIKIPGRNFPVNAAGRSRGKGTGKWRFAAFCYALLRSASCCCVLLRSAAFCCVLLRSAGFEPAAHNLEGCRSNPTELRTLFRYFYVRGLPGIH